MSYIRTMLSLLQELAPSGIRVGSVMPGVVDTPMQVGKAWGGVEELKHNSLWIPLSLQYAMPPKPIRTKHAPKSGSSGPGLMVALRV